MKPKNNLINLTIVVSLFIFSFNILGQNWRPINFGNKYNYLEDSTNYILTIWANSTWINQNKDTAYNLNRVLKDCDTCIGNYAIANQPQFLLSYVTVSSDSITFTYHDTFTIKPKIKLDSAWIWDAKRNITARITKKDTMYLFGTFDSIAEITLSTSQKVILSKNYGIIEFPDYIKQKRTYRLIGIEGKNVGIQIPKFFDFFDYEVGDIFEYVHSYYYPGVGPCTMDFNQYKIVTKERVEDTLHYKITGYTWDCTPYPNSASLEKYSNGLKYVFKKNDPLNFYHGQIIYNYLPDKEIGKLIVKYYDNDVIKMIGTNFENYPNCEIYSVTESPGKLKKCDLQLLEYYGSSFSEWESGLSLVDKESYFFESSDGKGLIGYMKDGIIHGTLTSTDLVSVNNNIKENNIVLFPNPVKETLTIYIHLNSGIKTLEIYDEFGKLVRNLSTNDETMTIKVNDLLPGIYICTFRTVNNIYTEKFIKE